MIELSEAEVKNACEEYLQYAQNQGKLWYCRLNAGDFIEVRGGSRRRIKGAGKGTADLIVIQAGVIQMFHNANKVGDKYLLSFVTFVECKSTKGKQEPSQKEFQAMVEKLHCRYAIVRSVDDLQEVLKRE